MSFPELWSSLERGRVTAVLEAVTATKGRWQQGLLRTLPGTRKGRQLTVWARTWQGFNLSSGFSVTETEEKVLPQIWLPGKQTLRWGCACKQFTRCSGDPHPWESAGGKDGQRSEWEAVLSYSHGSSAPRMPQIQARACPLPSGLASGCSNLGGGGNSWVGGFPHSSWAVSGHYNLAAGGRRTPVPGGPGGASPPTAGITEHSVLAMAEPQTHWDSPLGEANQPVYHRMI